MEKKKATDLKQGVLEAYSAAAEDPEGFHPFPVGRDFALNIGYSEEVLAGLPDISVSAFAGVSNLSLIAEIPSGSNVLDLGCGAGMDSLIAAGFTGSSGRVAGIDFSESMIARARIGAAEAGYENIDFYNIDADNIPLPDGFADVALVNGIFNLNPDREPLFYELSRIVKPGGAAFVAEIILTDKLPTEEEKSSVSWFA